MKRYLLPVLFLCSTAIEAAKSPLLVLLIMVKNEQDAIVPTLETYLSAELTVGKEDHEDIAYVVYDTGSTDETVERARQFFKDRRVVN